MSYTLSKNIIAFEGDLAPTSRPSIQARCDRKEGALEQDAKVAMHSDTAQADHMLSAARVSAGPTLSSLQPPVSR